MTDSDIPSDEAGGMFIQCDICKVWQHGGCVGIMDEAASPDEYFCEECKPEFHKLMTSAKGYVIYQFDPTVRGPCWPLSATTLRASSLPCAGSSVPSFSALTCMTADDLQKNRQKYSRYLPIVEQSNAKHARKTSVSKEPDDKTSREKDRNARASVESFGKRRSTMNSRAAYDEDEVLRKVLEESKNEGPAVPSENGLRKKRSRDDSEE